MKYNITGRNITITDRLRNQIEKKLSKLEKFFPEDTVASVSCSVRKEEQTVEVTIPLKGSILRAEETTDDMYATIDLVEESLVKQLRRHRSKLIDRNQQKLAASELFAEDPEEEFEEPAIRIERVKRFDIMPMDPEEACLQMDLLGHSFFVFKDAETDETCVVYKRKNNTYGLIEPVG